MFTKSNKVGIFQSYIILKTFFLYTCMNYSKKVSEFHFFFTSPDEQFGKLLCYQEFLGHNVC